MRKILTLLLLVLILGACGSISKWEPLKENEEVSIVVATDMHFLATEFHDGGYQSQRMYDVRDGKLVCYGTEIMSTFIEAVIATNPTALILTGDLTFNGEKQSHEELAEMFKEVKDAGIQVFVSPGNHDIRNPAAYSFIGDKIYYEETIEPEEFREIYDDFGFSQAITKDEATLSYMVELREDIWILMLDANRYRYNSGFGSTSEGKFESGETIEWMRSCFELAKENNAKIITTTHQSLLENVYLHSEDYRIVNSNRLRELMAEFDSKINLSGHIHTQSIVSNEYEGKTLYEITTEALSVAQNNYGYITISDSDEFHYQAIPLDVQGWARRNNIEDPNLLNFAEFGMKFYEDMTYEHFLSRYLEAGVEEDDAKKIARMAGVMNPYYFSGRIHDIKDEIVNSEAYRLLDKYSDLSNMNYIKSMFTVRELSQTEFRIQL